MTTLNLSSVNSPVNSNNNSIEALAVVAEHKFKSLLLDHKIDNQMFVQQEERFSPAMLVALMLVAFFAMSVAVGLGFRGGF